MFQNWIIFLVLKKVHIEENEPILFYAKEWEGWDFKTSFREQCGWGVLKQNYPLATVFRKFWSRQFFDFSNMGFHTFSEQFVSFSESFNCLAWILSHKKKNPDGLKGKMILKNKNKVENSFFFLLLLIKFKNLFQCISQ